MSENHVNTAFAVRAQVMSSFNYALHFSGMPLIREISIQNKTGDPVDGLTLVITSDIPFMKTIRTRLPELPSGKVIRFSSPELNINSKYLFSITEAVDAVVSVELTRGDASVAHFEEEVRVLAYDQWQGPEIGVDTLASFVTPNHPVIAALMQEAAAILKAWKKPVQFDGYQSGDPNRVRDMAASAYAAIQKKAIVYAEPPASYWSGQRIRTCDMVLEQRLGTCMDMTLLYAALLEQMGIHPVLSLMNGHIFAGFWLVEESFKDTVIDDEGILPTLIGKDNTKLSFVECTAMCAGQSIRFDRAEAAGHMNFSESEFNALIDITACRQHGIRPIPSRIVSNGNMTVEHQDSNEITEAPTERTIHILELPAGEKRQLTKRDIWESKLLDLSQRNMLLSLPLGGSVMPIMSSYVDEIEDALADGEEFVITPSPEWVLDLAYTKDGEKTPRPWLKEQLNSLPPYEITDWPLDFNDRFRHECRNHRLHAYYVSQDALEKDLTAIYRAAKSSQQENGISGLYLAVGMLRCLDKEAKRVSYAPLILVPVEMVRKSAHQGYALYRRDEDSHFNTTLLELMRQKYNLEIPGVEPMPKDDHGIDVRKVFAIVRNSVLKLDGWDVVESCALGNFSFAQFAMWNDLHTNPAALEKNDIVRSLLKGHVDWQTSADASAEDQQVYLPINVDATQLEAIRMAAAGNTFVLHGPPGTGKSQTITAMIANAVAHGKSVLFVAEKMAALSVVDHRLTGLGIGDFCLELHSDKANKKHVLSQLDRALNASKEPSGPSYPDAVLDLSSRRDALDAYARHLYEPRGCGFSLREMVDLYSTLGDEIPSVSFTSGEANAVNAENLRMMPELLRGLIAAGNAVGTIPGNPLLGTGLSAYTSEVRNGTSLLVARYADSLAAAEAAGKDFAMRLGFQLPLNQEKAEQLYSLAGIFLTNSHLDTVSAELLSSGNTEAEIYLHAVDAVSADRKSLLEKVDFDLLGMDMDALGKEHAETEKKLFGKAKAVAVFEEKLKPHCYRSLSFDQLPALFDEIRRFQQQEKRLQDQLRQVPERYRDGLIRFDSFAAYRQAADRLQQTRRFPGGHSALIRLADDPASVEAAERFTEAWEKAVEIARTVNALLMREPIIHADDYFGHELTFCKKLTDDPSSLKEWVLYQSKRKQCEENSFLPAVRAYESGMNPDRLIDAARKGLFSALINEIIGSDPVLGTFSGATFNESVQQFRRMDEALIKQAKVEIKNRLIENLPSGTESIHAGKELNLLRKAIQSGGRGLSIRALFDALPTILQKLCPCMLMSPNSVAQYLSHDLPLFDVVIFDEASQLPTCKAVGALSRAKAAVIVGDPKQMPPTSFFSGNGPDVNDLSLDDLDSILDDCLALGIPSRYLQWHYRSTHESLIAFSNGEFYENKMFTFPSSNDRERHVNVVYVDGIFERNKGRCNRKEAEAIVNEVIRRYRSEELKKYSVGIVTFNVNQQKIIEDMLAEAFRADQELDAWANTGDYPLFVKNLENVQGDERDIILFSIGYGPDADGHISMNFGPINQDGGWKRLNVAFSRSRVAMTIFSSLHPEQIDLRRTSSEGVAALRDFLLFAEGRQPAAIVGKAHKGNDQGGIIGSIRKFIEANGYQVETMIGQSDFHVDMAVVDPGDPSKYLLGILLDGDTYRNTTYTRDREVAQESVLKNLGWKLHRIWTIDWWDSRSKEQDRLLKLLAIQTEEAEVRRKEKAIRRESGPAQASPFESVSCPQSVFVSEIQKDARPLSAHDKVRAESPAGKPVINRDSPEKTRIPRDESPAVDVTASGTNTMTRDVSANLSVHESDAGSFKKQDYVIAEPEQLSMNSDRFCAKETEDLLRERVLDIVQTEAPIARDLLIKRLLRSCGISRSSAPVIETAEKVINSANLKYTKHGGMLFYWTAEQNPLTWFSFRDVGDRTIDCICKQELRSALCFAVQKSGPMSKEVLYKEASQAMGYSRLTQQMRDAFENALTFARNSRNVIIDNEGIVTLNSDL